MAGGRVSFFTKMRKLKKDIFLRKDRSAGEIYAPIEKYVRSCKYTSYKDAERFVNLVLGGYSDDVVAEKMQISKGTVRWREHDLSGILYNIFGSNFFELMEDVSGNWETLKKLTYLVKSDCFREDFIPMDIISLVSHDSNNDETITNISLDECYAEIDFLSRHSLPCIRKELQSLDSMKLDYLFRMVEGTVGDLDERYSLLKILEGE